MDFDLEIDLVSATIGTYNPNTHFDPKKFKISRKFFSNQYYAKFRLFLPDPAMWKTPYAYAKTASVSAKEVSQ